MNFYTAVPSGTAATRHPVRPPTSAEAAARVRAARRVQYHQRNVATLLHDPSGDFAPGMALSLPEIACGLKGGVWAAGTVFQVAGQRLTTNGDGWVRDPAGQAVILVSSIGR